MLRILKKSIRTVKVAGGVYGTYFGQVLLLGATFVFPIQLLMLFSIEMATLLLPFAEVEISLLFTVMAIVIAQIPFIYIFRQDYFGKKPNLGDVFKSIPRYFTPVYVFSLAYALMITVGYILFVVPGIMIAILFFFFPYYTLNFGKKDHKTRLKETLNVGFEKFPNIVTVVCFVVFIEASLWWVVSNLMFNFTGGAISAIVLLSVHILLDFIIFPFFVFIIGDRFMDWTGHDTGEEAAVIMT